MRLIAFTALALAYLILSIGCAGTRIDGSYMLVERRLPNGTVQKPPQVNGLATFDEGMRNLNVHWTDARGRNLSTSAITKFTISEYEYSETNLFYVTTATGDPVYDLTPATGRAEIVYTSQGMRFGLPLHNEPMLEFSDDGFTATRTGEFVDHWKRVKSVREAEARAAAAERKAAEDAAKAQAETQAQEAAEPQK